MKIMDALITLNVASKQCELCKLTKVDDFRLGPLFQRENFVAHYYCVLFSDKVPQRGKDEEGIMGFLVKDLEAEVKRVKKILCIYCQKPSASIHCAFKNCNIKFHFPCGIEKGSLHQFCRSFKSYCIKHRLIQQIPEKVVKKAEEDQVPCAICYESVDHRNRTETIWANCCRTTWYHRDCLQRHALSSGYFFKCAICNNRKFKMCVQKYGIFVPQKDASWELEPNAFGDLTRQYSQCDAEDCKCPRGRDCDVVDTMWEIVLCRSCGSQGMHVLCGQLKFHKSMWQCELCKKVTAKFRSGRKKWNMSRISQSNGVNTAKNESERQSDEDCSTSSARERVLLDSTENSKLSQSKTGRKRKRSAGEDGQKPVKIRNKRRKVFGSRVARREVGSAREVLNSDINALSINDAKSHGSNKEEVGESPVRGSNGNSDDECTLEEIRRRKMEKGSPSSTNNSTELYHTQVNMNYCVTADVVEISDDQQDSEVEVILDEEDSRSELNVTMRMMVQVSDKRSNVETLKEKVKSESVANSGESVRETKGEEVTMQEGGSNGGHDAVDSMASRKASRRWTLDLERFRSHIRRLIESNLNEKEKNKSVYERPQSSESSVSTEEDNDDESEIEVLEVIQRNDASQLSSQGCSGSSEEIIEIE